MKPSKSFQFVKIVYGEKNLFLYVYTQSMPIGKWRWLESNKQEVYAFKTPVSKINQKPVKEE